MVSNNKLPEIIAQNIALRSIINDQKASIDKLSEENTGLKNILSNAMNKISTAVEKFSWNKFFGVFI